MAAVPVTAVVVNYNGEQYLPECLRSVLAQGPDEVMVVDSGSTDGSLALLARDFPDVRALPLGDNRGPAAARNAGLRAARHELVLCVDNDVVLLDGCLPALVAALEASPQAALVQARSLCHAAPDVVHYDGAALHYAGLLVLRNWFTPLRQAEGAGVVAAGAAIALCILVRRAAALQAGGFFEAMAILFEDNDLSFRLRAAGHDVLVHADARCLHKGGTPGLSVRSGGDAYAARRSLLHSRNRWLYVLSCYRLRTLLLVAPALLAYGLVHLVFVVTQGHLVAWLRGKAQVVRLLPAIRERRRLLAAIRTRPDRALLVCAPLTYNPGLTASRPRAVVQRALDGFLSVWWRLVRGAVG